MILSISIFIYLVGEWSASEQRGGHTRWLPVESVADSQEPVMVSGTWGIEIGEEKFWFRRAPSAIGKQIKNLKRRK